MTAAVADKFAVQEVKPLIGAVVDASKEALLSGKFAGQIREMLEDRGVIVFSQVHFDDEEQIEFTKTLGKWVPEMRGDVFKISMDKKVNPQADYVKGAFYWHIDGTMQQVPLFASILTCKKTAPVGGNTEFCNTYAAYDALSDEEKEALGKLRVVHSFVNSQLYVDPEPSLAKYEEWEALGTNELPLVWTHDSGRKSLVLGSTADYIVGMDPLESRRLLVKLRDWATQERFSLSHTWSVGDAVLWDNTGTMHRAMAYPLDCDRQMHRTKLEGEEAFS
ncbi:TauD/TfdA dioxygenase family protein [Novosphingobium album (ex Hu et al. 2023)]|uniref:TauD/TfdA family dioxygenase n=1 Tax=Novosphingobium album (ex Hu et al. 2023) TaxID=2930093 RepID=A0ABT0B736_9SPHN|nr:TauD/TfdA family dioxygenase [Novosphingobium album (ex Hu et al. 2023)]MCJ2180844.1 TauD/TfdA family dioxygenase [Novosphingobium album (ex Hu et al. 2023)]